MTESEKMAEIAKLWFGNLECTEQDGTTVVSSRLSLESFKGVFFIAWISSTTALAIFLVKFLSENKETLTSQAPVLQKLKVMGRTFNEKKGVPEDGKKKEKEQQETEMSDLNDLGVIYDATNLSPDLATSLALDEEGMFSPDEGLSSAGQGTSYHDAASAVMWTSEDRQDSN